ncbi:MAG: hypothetical protein ACOYNZ_15930 [Rhodoferax sp.]
MTGLGKALSTVTLGLCMAACVTTEKAQNSMQDRFIGQPIEAFFSRYGTPQSSFPMNSSTIYRWRGGQTSMYVPAEYKKIDLGAAGNALSKSSSTTNVSKPSPNTTVTETTTTSVSLDIGALLNPQALVTPARTVEIFCEAQITVDSRGVIQAIQVMQDTQGAGLSLSRCAEVFDVK